MRSATIIGMCVVLTGCYTPRERGGGGRRGSAGGQQLGDAQQAVQPIVRVA